VVLGEVIRAARDEGVEVLVVVVDEVLGDLPPLLLVRG
jgi:hypothetical protein